MRKMRNILLAVLCLVMLASCGGPELLSIYPVYVGEPVTSTHHTFSREDFMVIAAYTGGIDETVDDFEFEVRGMDAGYYVIDITYEGLDNPVFVPIEAKIFPSDFKETDVAEDTDDQE